MAHTINFPLLLMVGLVSFSWWPRDKEDKTGVCCHKVEGNALGV